jgi:hypothetical protein
VNERIRFEICVFLLAIPWRYFDVDIVFSWEELLRIRRSYERRLYGYCIGLL